MQPVTKDYLALITTFETAHQTDDVRLEVVKTIADDLEILVNNPQYPAFLDRSLKIFLKYLVESETVYIIEHNGHLTKKTILEILHRLPSNDYLKKYVKDILDCMFRLVEIENEENVLICLRIIIELHKQFRPFYCEEVQKFLLLVQNLYSELPKKVDDFCYSPQQFKAKDVNEIDVKKLVDLIYGKTKCSLETPPEGVSHLSPKAMVSLRVLSELPIIVVLMYQLYKTNVEKELNKFIPLIMNTINLQPTSPSESNRKIPFNKEIYVDFNAAQIKALSFLAYVVKLPIQLIRDNSQKLIVGFLSLLKNCPPEVAHLRKELLVAAKHILATDLKTSFVICIEQLFDEKLLISNGWTAHETLRPLAFSTIADLVHHVRFQLTIENIASAINLFSKNLHDETLPTYMQTMSCKLLLNLADCLAKKAEEQKEKAKLLPDKSKAKEEVKAKYLKARDLLIKMLEVFVLKFKSIAQLQLPILMAKYAAIQGVTNHPSTQNSSSPNSSNIPSSNQSQPTPNQPPNNQSNNNSSSNQQQPNNQSQQSQEELKTTFSFPTANTESLNKDEKSKFGFPLAPSNNYTIADCRSLVKTLVCGVKTITLTTPSHNIDAVQQNTSLKVFQPKETIIFIRLLKYGLQALDIYTLTPGATNPMQAGLIIMQTQRNNLQTIKSKEEKEILEMFSEIFQMLSPQMFHEIFTISIEFMVERIYFNNALQIIASTFLANVPTSAIFATILVEFLLSKLEEMGSNIDKSHLYLRLFKLVFGSVTMFAQENEKMLKPHLHNIINKSMKYALCAKEPYNYFLMLRALFRSIGGGSHDLLYQEFLPLLPTLLQGLNGLQSGVHKHHMKELFVELCLTVPVRLSSLLPYLPMLMDPLVSALNGSQSLVSQGLRTLELCVDNLQPDFLYDHIQPVRADLMQALWKTLRNPQDSIAQVSFRVLGKFGGGNRKMMTEPQKLEYTPFKETQNSSSSTIQIYFTEYKQSIELRLDKIIETAFNNLNNGASLKSLTTESYYRKQCWEVIKGFLIAHMQMNQSNQSLNEKQLSKTIKITQFFSHPSFSVNEITNSQIALYKLRDGDLRKTHEMALTGMFLAAAIKELAQCVLPFMVNVVRHYTLVAISQQSGPINLTNKQNKLSGMDPLVIIDAVAAVMGHEEKELCKPGHIALVFIIETASSVLKSKERACALPLCEYLIEKMCALCYERAWYAKVGGCIAIKSLFERMTLKWVLNHQYQFLKALFFVMMDLSGEVTNGAIDMAKTNLEKLLNRCATPLDPAIEPVDLIEAQKKSLNEVTTELVRHITSANTFVREQAINSLHILAKVQSKTISQIIEPHKEILSDMIPPKKHLLRHQPVNAQIGIMHGNTFCMNIQPRLFTIDISIQEHRVFFIDVFNLCDAEDAVLSKHPCYKNTTNLVPLRKSALHALASCYYIEQHKDKIFAVLFKALDSKHHEIQETGFECMKKFMENTRIEVTTIHNFVKPLIKEIAPKNDASNTTNNTSHLTMNLMQRLSYMTQLFPNIFTEILCHQMYTCGHGLLSEIAENPQSRQEKLKILVSIINLFHQVPAASDKFVEKLLSLVFLAEKMIMIEAGSNLREPLRKFLMRYPDKTMELLLKECNIKEDQIYRFLKYLLSGTNGLVFRQILMRNPAKLILMASGPIAVQQQEQQQQTATTSATTTQQQATTPDLNNSTNNSSDQQQATNQLQAQSNATSGTPTSTPIIQTVNVVYELDFQAVLITNILVKHDKTWLEKQEQLIEVIKKLWLSDEFMNRHTKFETLDYGTWKQPKLIVKCLLNYFQQKPDEILLLFNLLRVFIYRFVCDFDFFRKFLEQTVCHYSVEWKRNAFFKFKEIFRDNNYPQELKAKVLQYIIIPMFSTSFEKGETKQLIGGPPEPDEDSPDNLISIFINDIINLKNPCKISDSVRIFILQLSCLLLEQASAHIHDAANKRQGVKLKLLMTYAWPCLVANNCVDPATKYLGHLLLSHIIAKFAIHKKIVVQVFHSLLKAYALEARTIVRQALEILIPAMPQRMGDDNTMLTHWTKKIIVEEGYTITQLIHILQLLIKNYKVYYPVRHHLIQHMVNSIQRLGFTGSASAEHRRIAVDLAEVIIRWEAQAMTTANSSLTTNNSQTATTTTTNQPNKETESNAMQVDPPTTTSATDSTASTSQSTELSTTDNSNRPVEKQHIDTIVNFLLRLACHVNDTSSMPGSPGELLSRRCVTLLKTALKPEFWPNAELKLVWVDKLFLTLETVIPPNTQPNYLNICTALDLLSFLLSILRKDQILNSFRPLTKGLIACMHCSNDKVIKCVHNLLTRLIEKFPLEDEAGKPISYEELNGIYEAMNKLIQDGLSSYEKMQNTPIPPQNLFSTLMLLKAVCINNPCYIDRLMGPFMRVIHKMAKDHLNNVYNNPMMQGATNQMQAGLQSMNNTNQLDNMATDLLIYSLDLVKNRIGVMVQDMRKTFFSSILLSLIEKSPDVKILKAITKMVEDWVKNKSPFGASQLPSTKEKTQLLIKLMHFIEKRFPDDPELNANFLELINYVYRDDRLKNTDLTMKLEQAFMAGLRFQYPQIRLKFFEVFDGSIRKRLYDRLIYIICSQNWENIGPHFWIKQAIQLVLNTANTSNALIATNSNCLLPSPTSVLDLAEPSEKQLFATFMNEEAMEIDLLQSNNTSSVNSNHEEEIDIEASSMDGSNSSLNINNLNINNANINNKQLHMMLQKQAKFVESIKEANSSNFLSAVCQLAHMDTNLASSIWIDIMPKIWRILTINQRDNLQKEIVPFICSGCHVIQKDCQPSVIGTFMEAIAKFDPPITIRPCLLRYLGSSHNLWHRTMLMLEDVVLSKTPSNAIQQNQQSKSTSSKSNKRSFSVANLDDTNVDNDMSLNTVFTDESIQDQAMDALSNLYESLFEEDMWAGLWQKRAKLPETLQGIAYEQQGHFEQAQGSYELAITKARNEYNNTPAPYQFQAEYLLLENHWIRCSKELNQWDSLLEFAREKSSPNPFLMLESSWRVPSWLLMRQAIVQVESNCPKEYAWKVALYKGFNNICNPDDTNLRIIDRMVELASTLCIKEWRRLPAIVTNVHLPLLQAAQQIMELQEAGQIHTGLLPENIGQSPSLHDMKAIVKTWRNRLPVLADDLSHWSDIFTWRQHHYQAIVNCYEQYTSNQNSNDQNPIGNIHQQQGSHSMLGVHASAQSIIHYGKLARKQQLISVCLDSLNRIHTIPSVPIVDCFQKIRQQVKCYLQLATTNGKQELQEGLEVIESTNLKYFSRDMTAEFFALKGLFLAQLGKSDEANKSFSSAVQLHDTLVNGWASWGDYLESIFVKEKWENRQMPLGVSAITCYLHACRHQNESKSRKYLAKVLWLLSYDDETTSALTDAVEKYNQGVPALSWLPWIPQLLTCLVRNEGKIIVNILSQVGRTYPQAVYFPLRTLYLTLKMEQREKSREKAANVNVSAQSTPTTTPPQQTTPVSSTTTPIVQQLQKPSTSETASTTSSTPIVNTQMTTPTTSNENDSNINIQTPNIPTIQQSIGQPSNTPITPIAVQTTVGTQSPASSQPIHATNIAINPQLQQKILIQQQENAIKVSNPMWRCSKILHNQRDLHPTVLSSLEGIVDQLVWFRENWYEEVLRQLRQGLTKCYSIAFENRNKVMDAEVPIAIQNFVRKLVATFGIGIENASHPLASAASQSNAASESLARRAQATAQDPIFQRMKQQFTTDFDFEQPNAVKLQNLIAKLLKWIKILEIKIKLFPKSMLIEEKCRFLGNFSQQTADIELPGEFLVPKHNTYYVKIARFMPRVDVVHKHNKHNTAARRLYIRGHNGKIYPYLIVNDTSLMESRNEERVLQVLRLFNHNMGKQKETARRFLNFTVPKVVAISPQLRLVEDNCDSLSLLDIYKQYCFSKNMDIDQPITRYYERLANVQSKGSQASHQVLRDILKEIQSTLVPATMLKQWAISTFNSATDYCMFRKQFILQFALCNVAEYVLHLTRQNPDMIYIHQDSGLINISYFRFDTDDLSGELAANRPVPFRLTPNINELITSIGVNGPLKASMIATARCLTQPNFKIPNILKAILRDEFLFWFKRTQGKESTNDNGEITMNGELLVSMVNKAVNAITTRLQNLAIFDCADSKISSLVAAANSSDNLCRMDPAFHPWC